VKTLLKSWYTLSSPTLLLLLVFSGILLMAGCSGTPLSLLTGGGPNVAANTQAGKTNSQTIGTSSVTEQKLVRPQARKIQQTADNNKVKADNVQTVVVNEIPVWVVLLLILGWLLPSPNEIGRSVINAFRKKL
jgi:hypothetical protein